MAPQIGEEARPIVVAIRLVGNLAVGVSLARPLDEPGLDPEFWHPAPDGEAFPRARVLADFAAGCGVDPAPVMLDKLAEEIGRQMRPPPDLRDNRAAEKQGDDG